MGNGQPAIHQTPVRTFSRDDYIFALLLALVSTLLGYQFGAGNQVEQIPIILRQLDSNYLRNDFFVNTTVEFGPRLYFAKFIAALCVVLPLHGVYLLLAYVSDVALVLITLWAARSIFNADRLASAIAAILALGVTSIHLGEATQIRYEIFQPASLAIPLALLALAMGLRGRPITAAIIAGLASLPHPLYGAECGAVALGVAFFVRLYRVPSVSTSANSNSFRLSQLAWRDAVIATGLGGVIFAVLLLIFWWWPNRGVNMGESMTTTELFSTLAYYRAPHHYLPSHFPLRDYLTLSLFVLISGFSYRHWSGQVNKIHARLVLLPIVAVIIGCLAGVLFTEIWPSSLVLTLQPFRLLVILKWLGFMVLAWMLVQYWVTQPGKYTRHLVGMSVLSGGVTHSAVNFAALSLIQFKPWKWTPVKEPVWVVLMMLGTVGIWWIFGALREGVFLFCGVMLLGIYLYKAGIQLALASTVIVVLILAGSASRFVPAAVDLTALTPVFTLDAQHDLKAQTARAAGSISSSQSVYITPPQFSILRIIGQRAMVVDFKAIPFQHQAMREWRQRMTDLYGEVNSGGFVAAREFHAHYRQISDSQLALLGQKYAASHAILYTETATSLPVLYQNEAYKIVALRK